MNFSISASLVVLSYWACKSLLEQIGIKHLGKFDHFLEGFLFPKNQRQNKIVEGKSLDCFFWSRELDFEAYYFFSIWSITFLQCPMFHVDMTNQFHFFLLKDKIPLKALKLNGCVNRIHLNRAVLYFQFFICFWINNITSGMLLSYWSFIWCGNFLNQAKYFTIIFFCNWSGNL
jgi:hypothetical protein